MGKNKIIVPTGYMGSGSSAITDLLSEVEGINAKKGTFEYVFLHCPNGVFDLEDKLLHGNNAVRSDEAIHEFYHTMRQLYDKKYWWVGHYKENVGENFWRETKRFLKDLIEFDSDFYWYYQENVTPQMVPQLVYNRTLGKLPGLKNRTKKVLKYPHTWMAFPTPEEFYAKAKKYIYSVFDLMGKKEENIILDQMLLPFNLFRMENYFDDDVVVFVVERDPRDVFIINKYFWSKEFPVPYPTDVEKFCSYYAKLRGIEKECTSKNVYRIKFEDLIYKYDETVDQILKDLNMDPAKHIGKKTKFIPEKSIKNTQLFNYKEEYVREAKIIEERLGEYLYQFPYEFSDKEREIF